LSNPTTRIYVKLRDRNWTSLSNPTPTTTYNYETTIPLPPTPSINTTYTQNSITVSTHTPNTELCLLPQGSTTPQCQHTTQQTIQPGQTKIYGEIVLKQTTNTDIGTLTVYTLTGKQLGTTQDTVIIVHGQLLNITEKTDKNQQKTINITVKNKSNITTLLPENYVPVQVLFNNTPTPFSYNNQTRTLNIDPNTGTVTILLAPTNSRLSTILGYHIGSLGGIVNKTNTVLIILITLPVIILQLNKLLNLRNKR
jgi:hypothetical protein